MLEQKKYWPRPEIKGFPLAPGTDTRVSLNMRRVTHTEYPYNSENCGDKEDARYLYTATMYACAFENMAVNTQVDGHDKRNRAGIHVDNVQVRLRLPRHLPRVWLCRRRGHHLRDGLQTVR